MLADQCGIQWHGLTWYLYIPGTFLLFFVTTSSCTELYPQSCGASGHPTSRLLNLPSLENYSMIQCYWPWKSSMTNSKSGTQTFLVSINWGTPNLICVITDDLSGEAPGHLHQSSQKLGSCHAFFFMALSFWSASRSKSNNLGRLGGLIQQEVLAW